MLNESLPHTNTMDTATADSSSQKNLLIRFKIDLQQKLNESERIRVIQYQIENW